MQNQKLAIEFHPTATEGSAEQLKKDVLAKVGKITDVVASFGGSWVIGPVLDQSLEDFKKVYVVMALIVLASYPCVCSGTRLWIVCTCAHRWELYS